MPAPVPRMHGISHVTGGPDPIPGLLPAVVAGSYAERVLAESSLLAYWPLSDPDVPCQDISGNNKHLPNLAGTPTFQAAGPLTGAYPYSFYSNGTHGLSGVADQVYRDDSGDGSYWTLDPGDPHSFEAFIYLPLADWPAGSATLPVMSVGAGTGQGILMYTLAYTDDARKLIFHDVIASSLLNFDEWIHICGTHDGTTASIYYNGALVASAADAGHSAPTQLVVVGGHFYTGTGQNESFNGMIAHVAVYNEALTAAQIAAHLDGADQETSGQEGWILTIDEDGNPVWVPPPAVTVNEQPPAEENPSPPPQPTDPPDDVAEWIVDQPFVHGGSSFDVPPRTWTTIPFTSPLMQRWSNRTGSTLWEELDDTDPDTAGWVSDASDYTRRAIVIPHEMPFRVGGATMNWMQICLRLEDPAVQETTSYRALRVFETTRQKTLVQTSDLRDVCTAGDGATNVYCDPDRDPDTIFATDGTIGAHGNVMFCPNSEQGFELPGETWLPKDPVTGDAMLQEGMRLVAQVWHDATVTLTFHCDPPAAAPQYKPHLVVSEDADSGWGPPWSTWYP